MNSKEKASLWSAVFRNSARDPGWMGFWLTRHREHEKISEEQLARKLDITFENLVLMHLCRTPREDQFQDDIRAICQRTGATEMTVLGLLRQEQNLDRLKKSGLPSSQGWLMAASDETGQNDDDDQGIRHESTKD
jgi:hypothetical protein